MCNRVYIVLHIILQTKSNNLDIWCIVHLNCINSSEENNFEVISRIFHYLQDTPTNNFYT